MTKNDYCTKLDYVQFAGQEQFTCGKRFEFGIDEEANKVHLKCYSLWVRNIEMKESRKQITRELLNLVLENVRENEVQIQSKP